VPEHHSTLRNASGIKSKKASSAGFDLDQKGGLEGEVLIFSTFCTLAPTTQKAKATRMGLLIGTNKKYVPSANGLKI